MTSPRPCSTPEPDRWSERAIAMAAEWPWSRTLAVGLAAVLAIRLLAPRVVPSLSGQAGAFAWYALGGLLALRYCAALVDGARRADRARATGQSRLAGLAVLLVPAEAIGLAGLVLLTIDGCIAWATRRPFPKRPEGRRFEDRRKGFYDAMFFLNVVPFVVELPLSLLFLSRVHDPWVHIAVHSAELLLLVLILGDRWLVRAAGTS